MSKRAGAKVIEINGSHAAYVSKPQAVAHLIEEVAKNPTLAKVSGKDTVMADIRRWIAKPLTARRTQPGTIP